MAGILIEYARFVEMQHRRAALAAALGQSPETPAPPRPKSPGVNESIDGSPSRVDMASTRGAADVR
jgi:hypothetical protein